jgi:D-alanyl-lipoteichoic acid acyltransferase DltB (MBOAT superfamily)
MTFTTLTFLLFVPLVFGLYWSLPRQGARNLLLVAASYVFYAWWDVRFSLLMLAASLVDFSAGLLLARTERETWRRAIVAGSCTVGLGLLGFFKYFHFFADNLRLAAASVGVHLSAPTLTVVLPVGISFYTFQTLSYVIDVYRRRLPATRDVVEYMAYVSFFPQLVAGPIERGAHLLPQFQSLRRFDLDEAREGLRFMLWGFFKKMALADNLGAVVDAAYARPFAADGPTLALATFAFAFQIYCDFSAYSDIAVGCGRLFGVRLMRNFAHPYFARSVAEFWRRWHISLSTWFGEYVYVPLGGNRTGRARQAVNVMITFLLSGFWHGASWNFVIWGGLNGLMVVPASLRRARDKARATDVPGGEGRLPSPAALAGMLGTFAFACVAWVFFRARTFTDALTVFDRVVAGPWTAAALGRALAPQAHLVALVVGLVALEWATRRHWHPLRVHAWPRPLRWALYTALIWATLGLSRGVSGAFIYFQF